MIKSILKNAILFSIILMFHAHSNSETMTPEESYAVRKTCDMKEFYDYTLNFIKNLEELDKKITIDIQSGKINNEKGKFLFQEAMRQEDDRIFEKRQARREKLKNIEEDAVELMDHLRMQLSRLTALKVFVTQTRPSNEIRLKKMLHDNCKELAKVIEK